MRHNDERQLGFTAISTQSTTIIITVHVRLLLLLLYCSAYNVDDNVQWMAREVRLVGWSVGWLAFTLWAFVRCKFYAFHQLLHPAGAMRVADLL